MICRVKNCKREAPYKTLKLCPLHYNRYHRLGHTDLKPKQKDKKCKYIGCSKLVGYKGAKGFCYYHYQKYIWKPNISKRSR